MIKTESKSVTYNKGVISGNYANSILLSDINFIQRRNLLQAVRQKNKTNKYSLSSQLLIEDLNIPDHQIKRIENLIKSADSQKVISQSIKDEILNSFRTLENYHTDFKRKTKYDLKRKIRNKIFSFEIALNLAVSNPNSPLFKSYLNTINFCQSNYQQDGYKITSRYCNCRHCYSCNRIRSGKLINSYSPLVKIMNDKYMVTLTIPNVSKEKLRESIVDMKETFTLIKDVLRKRKIKFTGLRKLECTYNQLKDSYHPHFHVLVNGAEAAQQLHDEWINYNPMVSELAQDITPADDGSVKELFKYFTKFWSKKKNQTETIIDYTAQDVIYQSISGMRIFQSFGITKEIKQLMQSDIDESEDIDPKENSYFNIDPQEDIYYFNPLDKSFVSPNTGSELINFKLNKKDLKLLESFNHSVIWDRESIRNKKELIDPLIAIMESKYMDDI